MKFDPSIFISPPFTHCPKCHSQTFGVLMINNHSYIKKCKECNYKKVFDLPKLSKEVIYLDQFVISNMMKALNKKNRANQTGKIDEFWLETYKHLDILNKKQLIVCPVSEVHSQESIVSAFYGELKTISEYFSNGVRFYTPQEVKRFQIVNCFKNFIGVDENKKIINSRFILKDYNFWNSKLFISIKTSDDVIKQISEDYRNQRNSISLQFSDLFEYWKSQNKTFDEFYNIEINSVGPSIWRSFINLIESLKSPSEYEEILLPNDTALLFFKMISVLRGTHFEPSNYLKIIQEFLMSEDVKEIRYFIIESLLFAALARQATTGRIKPPSQGMLNDIKMLSAYLDTCDTFFVDNECRTFLIQEPIKSQLNVDGKIYSLNNKDDFLQYLNSVDKRLTTKQLNLLYEVYGEEYFQPYNNLYK